MDFTSTCIYSHTVRNKLVGQCDQIIICFYPVIKIHNIDEAINSACREERNEADLWGCLVGPVSYSDFKGTVS